jgi:hypothetical protein
MAISIQDIIKTQVCESIFQNGYPTTLENKHPFDFFMEADVDCAEGVDESPLGTEWNFEVASEYGFENIRSIRGLMQSMYEDLERFKNTLFKSAIKPMQLNKDECISDNVFYELIEEGNGKLHRQGTADEYATVMTVDAGIVQ